MRAVSMMMCDFCDAFIDTDYDCEGAYASKANKFMCSTCCEGNEIEGDKELDAHLLERT